MATETRGLLHIGMATLGEQKIFLPTMDCNKTSLKLMWIDMHKNYYIIEKLAALNLYFS